MFNSLLMLHSFVEVHIDPHHCGLSNKSLVKSNQTHFLFVETFNQLPIMDNFHQLILFTPLMYIFMMCAEI